MGSVNRLDVSAAAPLGIYSDRVILIDPTGAFAAFSIPQGSANFAHVDVRAPMAGTWTAYLAVSQSSGFNGSFAYQVVQTDTTTHGTVTPSKIVLAPGKSGTFTVHTKIPTSSGDLSASVQLSSTAGLLTSVPMTLRAAIPPYHTTFSGTITGGNGRAAGGVAQSNIYALTVPAGKTRVSIGITLSDPDEVVLALLTAPDGQVYSFQSNLTFDNNGNATVSNGLQIDRRNPMAGTWTLSLEVTNPVSGLEVTQHFTASVTYNTGGIKATGLPNNTKTKLAAGTAVNVPISIVNLGAAPATYFADPRLTTVGTIPLVELSGHSISPLPVPAGVTPFWLVPSEVSQLNASATADQPVNMDLFYESGDPDVYSAANGNGAAVQVNAAEVSPGIWETDIGQTGPFSTAGAPAGTVSVSASAQGQLFDPAVSSTTGDIWQEGVGVSADALTTQQLRTSVRDFRTGSTGRTAHASPADTAPAPTGPITLDPGQSATITVTITPSGAPGTVVKGQLYIDTFNNYTDSGNELIALPYSYTVK